MSTSGRSVATIAGLARPYAGRLRSPVAASMVGKGAEMVTLLVLATLVPRALGPSDFGVFAVALTVVTISSLSMALGGPTVMARFVPGEAAGRRAAVARSIGVRLAARRALLLALGAVVATGLVVAIPDRFPPALTALVMLALAFDMVATLAFQIGLGLGRTAAWSGRWAFQNSVLVAAVLLLHAVAGTTGAVAGVAVASAAALVLGVAAVAGPLRAAERGVPIPPGTLRFASLQAVSGLLVQTTHRGAVVAVAILAGSTIETGFAALAIGAALAATYIVVQAFTVSLPERAEQARDDPAGAEAALRRLGWGALLMVAPAALAGALVLEPAVPLVFGERFEGAVDAFGPALALVVLAPVNALAIQAAALRLRPEATLWSALGGAVAFLATAAAAVPAWGAEGGSAAALAGVLVTAVLSFILLPRAIGGGLAAASLTSAVLVLGLALAT